MLICSWPQVSAFRIRFAQADSIVPVGVQGLDRYAYVNNSPVRLTDPSGHRCVPEDECENNALPNQPNYDPSSGIARMRQDVTNMNYDTQLMLKIYIQDLLLLVSMGYELPDWLTEEDIQTIIDNDYFYEENENETP